MMDENRSRVPLKAFGNWRAKFKAEPQPLERKLLYRRSELGRVLIKAAGSAMRESPLPSELWTRQRGARMSPKCHKRKWAVAACSAFRRFLKSIELEAGQPQMILSKDRRRRLYLVH